MKSFLFVSLVAAFFNQASFAANTVFKFSQDESIETIRAMIYSGVKVRLDKDGRHLDFKDVIFKRTNGHVCDEIVNPFCGLGDPTEVYSGGKFREIVNLDRVLRSVMKPKLDAKKLEIENAAAGSVYWSYESIHCDWKLDAKTLKITSAECVDTFKGE